MILHIHIRVCINIIQMIQVMLYADDLAIITESKQKLQEVLEEWKGVFEKLGLRISLENVEWTPEKGAEHQVGW